MEQKQDTKEVVIWDLSVRYRVTSETTYFHPQFFLIDLKIVLPSLELDIFEIRVLNFETHNIGGASKCVSFAICILTSSIKYKNSSMYIFKCFEK